MWEIGEKVIYTAIDYSLDHYQPDYMFMTVGKKYSIIDFDDSGHIITKNNRGNVVSLRAYRFKSIQELRKQKLEKICSKLMI